MSKNRDIRFFVNGRIFDEGSQNEGIGLFNREEKIESFQRKVKSEKLILEDVYELYIDISLQQLTKKNLKLSVYCEEDEIPIIILKEYWDSIEEKIEQNEDEILEEILTSNHAIPCIFPSYTNERNESGDEKFLFKGFEFRNIYRNFTDTIDKSFYLLITKLNPEKKKDVLGLNYIEYREGSIATVDCSIQDVIDSNEKKIAIFVHGIASKVGDNFTGLYRCLEQEFNIFAFNYDSVSTHITDNGKLLESSLSVFGDRTVHIFAHSMGGLVSRSAIIEHKANIKSLVMAGTPNNGARIAKKVRTAAGLWGIKGAVRKIFIGGLFGLMSLTENDIRGIRRGIMSGLEDLIPESLITQTLNNADNFKTPYFVLAGNKFNKKKDGVVEVESMCNVRGILLPNIPIENCFHTNYFIANPSYNLPAVVSEARLYLKI